MRLMKLSILSEAPVISKTKLSVVVDNARAERVGEAQRFHAMLAAPAHLDHRQFAGDGRAAGAQIDDAMHRHQPLELIFDLFEDHRGAAGDDGDAGEVLLVLGLGDSQGIDVVAAAGKQTDYPRQHPRLVVDQHA
jgi:hypothetical protein